MVVCCLVGLLVDLLVNHLVGLEGCLVDWSNILSVGKDGWLGRMVVQLVDLSVSWLVGFLVGCIIGWRWRFRLKRT